VYLGWRDPVAAEALARSVSDPHSPSYGQYLTPEQFRAAVRGNCRSVAQVQSWLTSQGFSLVYTPQTNHYVSAKGTVARARAAFGTSFEDQLMNLLKGDGKIIGGSISVVVRSAIITVIRIVRIIIRPVISVVP